MNYEQINEKESIRTINFYQFFLKKYADMIKYILYSSPDVIERLYLHFTSEQRKSAWKGLILRQALISINIKLYVCDKLVELGLKNNTTLEEFYQLSEKKIQINFSAVETATDCISIINHVTRPSMPVWAAILATSSVPFFFPPLPDQL